MFATDFVPLTKTSTLPSSAAVVLAGVTVIAETAGDETAVLGRVAVAEETWPGVEENCPGVESVGESTPRTTDEAVKAGDAF